MSAWLMLLVMVAAGLLWLGTLRLVVKREIRQLEIKAAKRRHPSGRDL